METEKRLQKQNMKGSRYPGALKARYKMIFRIFTWLLIFIFTFEQSGIAGDRIFHKYGYSAAKDLLTEKEDLGRMGRMSASYLLRAQKKHEDIIRAKNLIEEEAILFLDKRSQVEPFNDMPLKRKLPAGGPGDKRIEYTLSDYDENGTPQQISVYSYKQDGRTLEKITSYDIRDMDAVRWMEGDLEEISEEDDPKVVGSFEKGDYGPLTDEIAVKTVVYFGEEEEEKIDYVLSDYRGGKPTEVSIYTYEGGRILKEVNTYDISSIASLYGVQEWKEYIEERNDDWRLEAESEGRLTRKAAYEGPADEEKLVYALSEYGADEVPGRIDCYDYQSGNSGPLVKTRTYNIKGVEISARLSDFREDLDICDERLTSTTIYKGKEDRETIDYILAAYYLDAGDGGYKPSRRSDYIYDGNGRLAKTETYCVKNGANILRQCSEFRGLRGKEIITRSYNYEIDGATLYSVSLYEYDLDPDPDNAVIGGDGNKYTLDRVTQYTGAADPHDLAGAKIREESYYDGPEGDEFIVYSFGFDVTNGQTVTRKEYVYDGKALDEVSIFRLTAPADPYDLAGGVKVSYTDYTGEEDLEEIAYTVGYDLAGQELATTVYTYGDDGALEETVTRNASGAVDSRTTYEGSEDLEKRTRTVNYDLLGDELTSISYEYDIIDALEKSTIFNTDGVKVSETAYKGIENNEKASLVTKFDLSGAVIGVSEYLYDEGCALSKIINKDETGRRLSETLYQGPENYERTVRSENYDLAGGLLSATEYFYDVTGALEKTVTEGFADEGRAEWRKFSETTYSGPMNREKAEEALNFDLLGQELTLTTYYYKADGSMERTVTADADSGVKLSETFYSGRMGFERVDLAKSYDLAGTTLTTTGYEYAENGAIERTSTCDPFGRNISGALYEGSMGRERIVLAEGLDLAGEKISATVYTYAESGALSSTGTYDKDDIKLSETVYAGLMDREKARTATTFDDDGTSVWNTTSYLYDPSGALTESVTRNAGGRLISETEFSGPSGREKNDISRNYDSNETLESIVHYIYDDSGALSKTQTREEDDTVVLSETRYQGLDGYEISDFTLNYKDNSDIKNTVCYYYNSFKGYEGDEAIYEVRRAEGAFREDVLVKAETYEGGSEDGSIEGLLLESIAYYKGKKNKEIVDFSQSYEFKPNDETERQVGSTTLYEYGDNRELVRTYTYFGGHEGLREVSDLKRNYVARYQGERGEEKIYEMEGTTCEYPLNDYTEWDYFVRTDFTYDDEERNTGYFEKIFSPEIKWDWEAASSDDVLIEVKEVKFYDFDEKDRYGRIEKDYFDWTDDAGPYALSGERVIQESFTYDLDDNITSYLETDITPEGETKRYKFEFVFEDNADKKPDITTSWELDEDLLRTGDYFRKSDLEYDEYGRLTSYTATSCNDGKTNVSYVFDITYDKDIVIRENVHTQSEVLYFGADHPERGYKYSTREFKYDRRKKLETTVTTNGDYVSISDADGKNIYFEWTAEMVPYREKDFVSEMEPEGAGPRAGSADPSSPVADILQETRKCAAHEEVIEGARTQIEYTEGGQVESITDIKGNVYVYSGNRLVELRDSSGNVRATVDYSTADEILTVSMESSFDDTSAVYTYDEDSRKLSADVTDPSGDTVKHETYEYAMDGQLAESVTVHREFREGNSEVIVDRLEIYDAEGLLARVYTHSRDSEGKNFVAKWTAGGYDDEDRLLECREVRCESVSFDFSDYIDGGSILPGDKAFEHIGCFEERDFLMLSEEEIGVYAWNDVLITDEIWEAEYYEDGNIKNSSKDEETFKYERIRNAVNWPGTVHEYYRGYGPYSHDGNWSSPQYDHDDHQNNRGETDTAWCKTVHRFDGSITLDEINFHVQTYAHRSESGSCNSNWYVKICQDGEWKTLWSDSRSVADGADLNSGERVNIGSWSGVTAIEIYAYACSSGGRDGKAQVWIYELETGSPDTEQFKPVQLSDVKTDFFAGDGGDEREYYDEKNNIIKYSEIRTEHSWHVDINGNEIDEGILVTETGWNALGAYDVDRALGFSQTVHKNHTTGTFNVTETTERTDISYRKGNIVSYTETFNTDVTPAVTTERVVSGMVYEYGKTVGFREVASQSGPGLDSTTTNIRKDMVYDGWGNLSSWTDLYTPDSSEYDISDGLRGLWEDDATGLKDIFSSIDGPGSGEWEGKTIIDWALETGYETYAELEDYSPWERNTTVSAFDDKGRMLKYIEVETAFKDVAAGAPREEQIRTTERLRTIYKAPNQIKNLLEHIKTIRAEDGSTVKEETVYKSNIVYNTLGQEYGYTLYADGEMSRVDSATYNSLGQLVETYTRIDAYSYSRSFYFYNQAGNISQTKNYYYFHKESEESDRNGAYRVVEHYEKTTWYDKYGEKTSEDVNQYVDVQVISRNFWSDFFGRTIISVISAVLSVIPGPGPFLSMAFNTIVSVIQGTFDWVSFAGQMVLFSLQQFGTQLFANIPGAEVVGEFFATKTGSWDTFFYDASVAATQAVVTEGMHEVGKQNNWDTFFTSALASFSSSAIGFMYGGLKDGFSSKEYMVQSCKNLTTQAISAMTIGAIDKFVEENPSEWTRFIAPIAKATVRRMVDVFAASLNRLTLKYLDTVKVSELSGKVAEAAKFHNAETAQRFYNPKDGKIYYSFGLTGTPNLPLSPLMQDPAFSDGLISLEGNLEFSNNLSLNILMSGDGENAYLIGEARGSELRGLAKKWGDLAGIGPDDKIKFQLDLRTGDLFMLMDVKGIVSFLSKGAEQHEDISKLKQTVVDVCGSIENLKGLGIAIKINGDRSELLNATMIVNVDDISNRALFEHVAQYMRDNFSGLRSGHADVVLGVDPKNATVSIMGLSLSLNETSVSSLLKSLKEQTGKLRKLGERIKQLVEFADNKLENFERITVSVNERGDHLIRVTMRSDVLQALPFLLSKLNIKINSVEFSDLSRYTFIGFIIDETGSYSLDLSFLSEQLENINLNKDKITIEKDTREQLCEELVEYYYHENDPFPDRGLDSIIGDNSSLTYKMSVGSSYGERGTSELLLNIAEAEQKLNPGSVFMPLPGFMIVNQGGLGVGLYLGLDQGYDAFNFLKGEVASLRESADPIFCPVNAGAETGKAIGPYVWEAGAIGLKTAWDYYTTSHDSMFNFGKGLGKSAYESIKSIWGHCTAADDFMFHFGMNLSETARKGIGVVRGYYQDAVEWVDDQTDAYVNHTVETAAAVTSNAWDGFNRVLDIASDFYGQKIIDAPGTTLKIYNWTRNTNKVVVEAGIKAGNSFVDQLAEFCNLKSPETYVTIDPVTNTAKMDMRLNYAGGRPLVGILDFLTVVRIGNERWNDAIVNLAKTHDDTLLSNPGLKGISAGGINTDGEKLDLLAKRIAPNVTDSFLLAHSAATDASTNTTVRTKRTIQFSRQEPREELEAWIDKMGYAPDEVLVVDPVGDLPYRPVSLIDLGIKDLMNPLIMTTPGNLLTANIKNLLNNNAYNDYSSNPNAKYTYVRIVDGFEKSEIWSWKRHNIAIGGALDETRKFTVEVNGKRLPDPVSLRELYEKFLRGEEIR